MRPISLLLLTLISISSISSFAEPNSKNRYLQENLVANHARYAPTFQQDARFINAWGIAIRPAGAGGHFWVTAKDKSFEYVGDVQASPEAGLQRLFQDALKEITLPVGGENQFATGTVFSGSKTDFVVTQTLDNGESVTAPAKFLFASDGGVVSAWTERVNADGSKSFPSHAETVIDLSAQGAQFFGIALNHDFSRMYLADFGKVPGIRVFDGTFKPIEVSFDNPFDRNKNGKVDAGEYAPFNVQAFNTPSGEPHIFVAYAKTQKCPKPDIKAGTCGKGEIFPGEEDTEKAGSGRLAEFTEDGKLVALWKDASKLNAPWGMAFAPQNFGALSNSLLVANFGDGTIAAYNAETRRFIDVLRNAKGKPVKIDKVWGLLFGNGASLGDSNALYFAAGPRDEEDGVFGSLRVAE
ncbi:MAG: TIGR03118 family protein [Methylophilaceae bacterium]